VDELAIQSGVPGKVRNALTNRELEQIAETIEVAREGDYIVVTL